MAFCGAGALDTRAQPAPSNDDFTNAQTILGITGSVEATNISATVEPGEPAPVKGVPAQSTIWYVWTAPTSITIDFNTRDSTDKNGLPLDTMLGVYVATPGLPVNFANLVQVAGNEEDPSGGVTSRVDFQAAQGTTYYIQVGSVTNSADGLSQGNPHLNWGASLVAGGFGFSTPDFVVSSLENFLPDNSSNSVTPSLFGLPQGSANARITVSRTGASTGRCEVTLNVGAGLYTNLYATNFQITNIFITNSISNKVVGFTNIFVTNIAAINEFENIYDGVFTYEILDVDEEVVVTNSNGAIFGPITRGLTSFGGTTFGLPNYFTNFPCEELTSSGMASNNGVITTFTTNIICDITETNVVVPAAWNNVQFTGFTTNLTFDDYQMSQDVYVQIYPILNTVGSPYAPFGQRNPQVPVDDEITGGPEDLFYPTNFDPFPDLFLNFDYNYTGLNSYIQLTLSNLVLDPLENPDILAPTYNNTSSGRVDIHNYWGVPALLQIYTNSPADEYVLMNFERYTWRCDKNCQTAVVWVQRTLQGINEGTFIHYTLDSRIPGITVIDDNGFATVADSDYAEPQASTNQQTFDFQLPKTMDWTGIYGTLTFPANSIAAQGIYIPITNNQAVEFDGDIELELFYFAPEIMGALSAMPPYFWGTLPNAILTINYNDIATNHVQPGGAVDRVYNVDDQPDSYPPDNLVPGANSSVNAVAIQPLDGKAVIGGDFDAFNTTPINYIARLETNGLLDDDFAATLGRGPNNFVNALVIDSSGRIVIGGNFTSVNSTNTFFIARLNANGSLDTTFTNGFGFNAPVYALALDASGNILVGGDFTSFNKTNCNHIARLFPGGQMDTNFLPSSGIGLGNGTDQDVHAVAVDNSGNIIVGGNFTRINGTNWNHIARLLTNGALDTTFNPGFGADGSVLALAVQPDNSIILGGSFQNFNLLSRNSIARLTPSGSLDASFAPGTGFNDIVYSLVLQPDGNILVGGQFTTYNGTRRIGMARLLGGQGAQAGEGGWLDTSFMDTAYNQFAGVINHYYNTNAYNINAYPPSNSRNQVLSMGLQSDGNIVIGGSFDRLGGGFTRVDVHNHQNVARIIGAPTVGPEVGGIGNYPGNIGVTQNPYTVDDTGFQLFVTLDRVNGSLGPGVLSLGTNTLPPSSSSATAADFGLKKGAAEYNTVWNIQPQGAGTWGWRATDGEYGFNNNVQTIGDAGESILYLNIHNDPNAAPIIYADLNLLNLNANNIVSLGGVTIPFGPALGQYSSELEIINDNFPTGTIGFSSSNYNVLDTISSNLVLTLVRTNGDYNNPSVTVNTINGTALEYTDFGPPTPNPVSFGSAQTATVSIPIYNHSTSLSNKFFTVYLSSPTAGATLATNIPPVVPSNAVVTIIDGNFSPGFLSFSAPTYSVLKGDTATISVTRTGAAVGQLTVQVGTSNGTAINGRNYDGLTNTLSWGNQDVSTKTITVSTIQDGIVEGPKTVNLFLSDPMVLGNSSGITNADVLASPSNAVLTIVDTDSFGNLNFLSPNFSVFQNAGTALITVTRTGGTDGSASVQYATFTPTNVQLPYLPGVPGSNYSATSGSLTFQPGVSSQSFSVPIISTPGETTAADRIVGLEIFSGNPTNIAAQFPKTATLTILDPKLHLNSAGSVDTTTQNGLGFNEEVNSLCLQPDGSLLAGGEFTAFNGYPYDYVSRLLPNGGFDTGFLKDLTGPNGTVWAVLSQTPNPGVIDGNIMIVGDFSVVNLANSPYIARLNLNGQLDTSFYPGSGADGAIYCIAQMFLPSASTNQANPPYYVIGGLFANYDGNPASGVARVTPNGTFDPNFNIGLGVTSSEAAVHALAITPNNQILVAGDFTAFDNQVHHHLVRLNEDGTLDTTFTPFDGTPSSDINGSIRALVVQPDGRILIGGDFTSIDGTNFNYIARLNSDGSIDTNFNVGVGCNNEVLAIALDSQLRILVGGAFAQASGVTRNGLTRLNSDGTVDPSINFGFGANGYVDAIAVQTNDEIDVAGQFSTFGLLPENNFARLYGGANTGDGSVEFIDQVYGVLESGTNATITFQRIGGTFGTPSVSAVFSTSNGTAIGGRDYSNVTSTITFPLGETFASAQVPIIDNTSVGPNLFVNLLLTNPPANTEAIGPQVDATLIITNVNAGVEFAASGFRQSATAGVEAIPIVRVGNPESTVFVTAFTGTNGSATPGVDYEPETNQLTFYPGQMTNYFFIPLLDSPTTFEATTVSLGLEDASNAIVTSPSTALLTIGSAQTGAGFLSLSSNVYTVSEGATNAVITILRTNGQDNNVTVLLTTSPGTAVPGVNYSNVSQLVTFTASGTNAQTVDIPIIQQATAGPNTTVNITLSDPTGTAVLGTPTTAVLTIVDDIADYYFSSPSYFTSEASGTVTLTILRGGPTNTASSVFYKTYSPPNVSESNGFALPNVDYVPTSGKLNFPVGGTLQTIPVTIIQGTKVNPVLSFQVLLQDPSNGTEIGSPGTATVGIVSDVTGFDFVTNSYVVGENGSNVVVTVNRLNPDTGSLSVHFNTSDNTAVHGVDYVATNGTLNFLDGQATNSFTVQILNPHIVESAKNFSVSLFGPSTNSYVVAPSNAVITITNVYVGLSFETPNFSVSECAPVAAIPVILSGLTNSEIQVGASTENGSGIAGVNYDEATTNLTFLPGQTVAYFYVTPINNHVIGPDHTVQLNLTNNHVAPPTVAGVELLNPSTALLTIEECNGAFIVASGTAFVNGSIDGSSGVIYSNDTVTVLLGLRDIAGGNTTNLVATLQASNGIINPSAAKSYGVLIENGPTVSEPFTFTAKGTNGQNITATLTLEDGSRNLGTVGFGFTVGGQTVTFANTNTIFLPENPTNYPTIATNSIPPGYGYPSLIDVSGIPGFLTKATVTLSNFGHTYPSDVDVVLEAPNGSNSILISHCGGSTIVSGVNLTLDQAATKYVPTTTKLTTGTYLPTEFIEQGVFSEMYLLPAVPSYETVPVGAPESPFPYGTNLSVFAGASPNGSWSLWAISDLSGDSGYISNGWVLNLSTGVPVENNSDLQVSLSAVPSQATVSNLLTYYFSVTNYGPSGATNLVITDYLPAGALYVSNSCNCGTETNGILTVSLPTLAVGAGTAFSLVVEPTNLGYMTNVVTALALEPDVNSNNIATNISLVSPASSDLGINLAGSPNLVLAGGDVVFSVQATNGGPSDAMDTTVVLLIPGFVVVSNGISASTGTFTNVGGTITWNVGDLPLTLTGLGATMTLTTEAITAGTNLASASVSSSVYDPLKGNNFSSVKIVVEQPLLSVSGSEASYQLTWSATASNYILQGAYALPPQGTWTAIPTPPIINGQYTFTLPGTQGYVFFRLSTQSP
jgi:uncharacterized delta-60 repeat protein/uncharacterized repeat protein (TIGR01451 family)